MRYLEGDWLAVAATGGGALLPSDFPSAKAMELWSDLQQGCGFSVILQHLMSASGASLTDLPQFALAVVEGDDLHVALRGLPRLTGGAAELTGNDVTTWHEERVACSPGLCLTAVPVGDAERAAWWPLTAGIARAGALELTEPAPAAPVADEPVAAAEAAPTPAAEEDVAPPPPPEPAVETVAPPAVEDDVPPPPPPPDPPADAAHSGNTTLVADDDVDDDDAPLHSTTFFADMFADPVPAAGAPALSGLPPAPLPAGAPPVPEPDHDGMTVASFAAEDDHDGMTILSAGQPASTTPAPAPQAAAVPAGPTVLARICRACGAANPTQKVACRSCGTPLTGDATRIPRPRLGTIMLPAGEVMAIEHPLVVGRRPEVTRFSSADVPVVVKVDDPHISSTHLKIDLEDWSVLVTNLGLNGTILRRAGQPDRVMGDGETVLSQVGDVYDIGSGAALTVVELA